MAVSAMDNKPCEWLDNRWHYHPCPALAVPGEIYCAGHLAMLRGPKLVKVKRAITDDDLLPYTEEELGQLKRLAELTKGGSR